MPEKIASFSCYTQSFQVTAKGDLYVGIVIPQADKYLALPMSDHPGMMLDVEVYVPDWGGNEVPYDPWQLEDIEDSFDRHGYGTGRGGRTQGAIKDVHSA